MKKAFVFLFVFMQLALLSVEAQTHQISDELKKLIKQRLENNSYQGISIGIISPEGRTYHNFGVKSLETMEPIDEHSVFEIGSISKTFTGVLLANEVLKGSVKLNDPIQNLLPDTVTAPMWGNESIQFVHLANHSSALPRLDPIFKISNYTSPYSSYTETDLYYSLNQYQLTRPIGKTFEYSNYATGLLGHLLASSHQLTYEEFLHQSIIKPLGLENTGISLSKSMKKHLTQGYAYGVEALHWDFLSASAGAGAIRSNTEDMLDYLAYNLGLKESNLFPAMQLSHEATTDYDLNYQIGLGWMVIDIEDRELIAHGGATGAYRSFIVFEKKTKKGVVVLMNSADYFDGEWLAYNALDSVAFPLENIPKPPIANVLTKYIEANDFQAATKKYWELKKSHADEYIFDEDVLNALGYRYIGKGELLKAKLVLKINLEAFPNSSNANDSYGEVLMMNHEDELAIKYYKKSIELNPDNTAGKKNLKKLEARVKSRR
ncbi:serine hydrolase [Aureibacter tunicatorum]|uniref:Beta-lactamase n=1 Tax=Aureibacter tunicatorum TaxID=866807 RepID=A0AAE4BRP6_9BACT|nr:serine hydrolase [Aureibacter tunicatorum]MDR6238886.1 CubicO group peptidase (beta-lactamase class C family) [Aureibacter tunicatorum]BDD05187.1 hypothetical protein AUTU_26700 [Aureibacter tunicatorum]